MIVIDASVCAAWLLPDERDADALLARAAVRTVGGAVPGIFPIEIRNVLLMAHRRNRIDRSEFATALEVLHALILETDERADLRNVVSLAVEHGLSVYDASYLELAMRRHLKLATLDRKLVEAARRSGVLYEPPGA